MSASVTAEETSELIKCLTAQQRSYETFSALSQKQLELIGSGETDELLGVLSRKQDILHQIDAIDCRLAPLKEKWPEVRCTLAAGIRAEVEAAIDQVRDVLAEVIDLERQSEQQLCSRREATLNEIRRANEGQHVHRAYSDSGRAMGNTGNRYVDITDEGAS